MVETQAVRLRKKKSTSARTRPLCTCGNNDCRKKNRPTKLVGHNAKPISSSVEDYSSISEASEITGINVSTIRERFKRGWTVDQALNIIPDPVIR